MGRTRHLFSHINLINILLTAILIFLVNYMLLPFLNRSISYSLPVTKKMEKTDTLTVNKQDQTKTPSPLDYMVITEQNLFHPERKIPLEVKEAQPLPKPEFVLYGTLISGDTNIAYMEDKKAPYSTPGREKRQTPLKMGESMSGFILKELSEDRVIMVRGEERLTVYLVDQQKPKERGVTAPAASTVVQSNQFGTQAPPPQVAAPQTPSQQTAVPPKPSPGEPAPKIPSEEVREATRQKFLEFFKGGLKR
jgi:hypothetical protein